MCGKSTEKPDWMLLITKQLGNPRLWKPRNVAAPSAHFWSNGCSSWPMWRATSSRVKSRAWKGGAMPIEVHLFLPQMRLPFPALIAKARAAEAAGFAGIALMDHPAPPMAITQPMFDAMVAASWIAASTERLTVGHLVLCDAMRHPAVLAKQA